MGRGQFDAGVNGLKDVAKEAHKSYFMAKLCRKPISPRVEARRKKIHGRREDELYSVFLEVPIGRKRMIEGEATKIYEVELQEQQECKKRTDF